MTKPSPVYEQTYHRYLQDLATLDLEERAAATGGHFEGGHLSLPFLERLCRVSREGIAYEDGRRPNLALCVILFKYILMSPASPPGKMEWAAYRNFRDAAPLAGSFSANSEHPIAAKWAGDPKGLEQACTRFAGLPLASELSYDLVIRFQALPRLPLLLLFNDAEEVFPADCRLLFEQQAACYLDMECLAMVAMLLRERLAPA